MDYCPYHYLSAPGLSWDVILKMTNTELELIPDPDIYIFFEKGERGGISHISSYRKANNKDLTTYVLPKNKKSKHIICLDANNLYGYYVMSEFLSTTGFKWIDPKKFDLDEYTSNSSIGCVLEFDLEYPKELQE